MDITNTIKTCQAGFREVLGTFYIYKKTILKNSWTIYIILYYKCIPLGNYSVIATKNYTNIIKNETHYAIHTIEIKCSRSYYSLHKRYGLQLCI